MFATSHLSTNKITTKNFTMFILKRCGTYYICTVKPLNKRHIGDGPFVPCREVVLLEIFLLNLLGHSMSNQCKKILTPTDLNENWFLHSVS